MSSANESLEILIKIYRRNPEKFMKLDAETRLFILTKECGPDPFVFKQPLIKSEIRDDDHFIISDLFREGNWEMAAKFLWFFGVSEWNLGKFNDPKEFIKFIKFFPFGCFRRGDQKFENGISNCCSANSWCYGTITPALLENMFSLYDANSFKNVIKPLIKNNEFSARYIRPALYAIELMLNRKSHSEHCMIFVKELSKKKLISNQDLDFGAYEKLLYLSIVPFHWSWKPAFKGELIFPRPIWSRKKHLYLTRNCASAKPFIIRVLIVLWMSKRHHNNFSIHKDIIDHIIRHLFNFHVESLELEEKDKREEIRELENMEYNDQTSISVKYDILPDTNKIYHNDHLSLLFFPDVVDLRRGLTIPKYRRDIYDTILMESMPNWKSIERVYKIIKVKLVDILGKGKQTTTLTKLTILTYCRQNNISRVELYQDKIQLKESSDEIAKMVQLGISLSAF